MFKNQGLSLARAISLHTNVRLVCASREFLQFQHLFFSENPFCQNSVLDLFKNQGFSLHVQGKVQQP